MAGVWKGLLALAAVAMGALVCTATATPPTAAPAVSPPEPEPRPSVQVPRLSVAPALTDQPPAIVRVHPEPTEEHKGCYVLAGVAVPLAEYHVVSRPRATYLTASVSLLCTTGEDLQLRLLLDCPQSGLCAPAGLFSRATRSYYRVPAADLELLYKDGLPRESYPTHVLVLRPTKLKPYADWGLP